MLSEYITCGRDRTGRETKERHRKKNIQLINYLVVVVESLAVVLLSSLRHGVPEKCFAVTVFVDNLSDIFCL